VRPKAGQEPCKGRKRPKRSSEIAKFREISRDISLFENKRTATSLCDELFRPSLADMTAIGFTGPIFIMIGAAWFLGEDMRADRWVAAMIGLAGVLVVAASKLTGQGDWYSLVAVA
jgi:hypothetical protein